MTSPARRPLASTSIASRLLAVAATVAALAALAALERTAAADDKQVCVAASEKGQQLRSSGKLVEAREQLMVCGRAECPKLIQQDCTQWTGEVLAALPSVVPAAKDRNGRDIVAARLTIDGNVATETLDGKPIVLDPGVHAFVFEPRGAFARLPVVKEQVVVKPGEKNRIVSVTFATADEAGASSGNAAGDARTAGTAGPAGSSPPVLAYVVGGLGIAALGAGGLMGLLANSDAHDLRTTCAPNCNQGDVDAIRTRYTISGVTAGIGGALLVTGVILFLVHDKEGSRAAAGSSDALLRF